MVLGFFWEFASFFIKPPRCAITTRRGLSKMYPTAIRYDTRCYFIVRSKADISQLNLRPRSFQRQISSRKLTSFESFCPDRHRHTERQTYIQTQTDRQTDTHTDWPPICPSDQETDRHTIMPQKSCVFAQFCQRPPSAKARKGTFLKTHQHNVVMESIYV